MTTAEDVVACEGLEFHVVHNGVDRKGIAFHPSTSQLFLIDAETAKVLSEYEKTGELPQMTCESQSQLEYLTNRIATKMRSGMVGNEQQIRKKELTKLTLFVSHGCNIACEYCFAGKTNQQNYHMEPGIANKAIEKFLSLDPKRRMTIFFFGGEPTTSMKEIRETVEYCKKYCADNDIAFPMFGIQTNATLLTPHNVAFLKENGFMVTCSLDGPQLVNDSLRVLNSGKGTYEMAARGIAELRKKGIRFNIEATYSQIHVRHGISVRDVFDHLLSLGAHTVHIMPVSGPFDDYRLTREQIRWVASEFRDLSEKSVESFLSDDPKRLQYVLYVLENVMSGMLKKHICFAGTGTVTVNAFGDVYPCYYLTNPELHMGNVLLSQFPNDRFMEVQKMMMNNTKDKISPCNECWARNLCNSCYGAEEIENKTLFMEHGPPEDFCAVIRASVEGVLVKLSEIRQDPQRWEKFVKVVKGEFGIDD